VPKAAPWFHAFDERQASKGGDYMQRSSIILTFGMVVVLAISDVAHSDPPGNAKVPTPPLEAHRIFADATAVPLSGPGLTFATARIEDGSIIIRHMRLVAVDVPPAAGNSNVLRPVHEEIEFPVDRATFIRPNGDELKLVDIEKVLAEARPVLLAGHPSALNPAYLALVNPNAVVVVLQYRVRVPSFSPPGPKQE
jgi:hypothetical protein